MKNDPEVETELARELSAEPGGRAGEDSSEDGPTVVEVLEELQRANEKLADALRKIENERLKYLELLEFAPDGHLVTTRDGVILEANRAAGRMLGLDQRFLTNRPLISYVAEEDKKDLRTAIDTIDLSPSLNPTEMELRVQPRDGAAFDARVRIAASTGAQNNPVTLRWLVRDVTERKQAEEEIGRLNAELERRSAERTVALENANRLKDELLVRERLARFEADRANRSKDEFLATFSHELRTPLNAILGWIHILRSHKSDDAVHAHAIEVIERNAMAQAGLINDILEISRIVSDKFSLEKRPLALVPIIEAAIDSVRPMAEEKGLQLNSTLLAGQVQVLGDPTRLQQVVLNLLTNAIKFTAAGGSISLSVESADGDATITISDTGQGIRPEFLPHVFDRFSQADSTMSRKQGGLGIGLAIVRHIVEMHGGTVSAASDGENKGATFTVKLPLPGQIKPARVGAAFSSGGDINESRLDGLLILVVDDEPDAREMLKVVLEQLGAKVILAGSCAEAIKAIEEQEDECIDVLVADIAMPGEDGFDLIRQVRAMRCIEARGIGALALTAYASDEDRSRVLSAGYHMHLPKPVSLLELSNSVAKLGRMVKQAQTD